MLRHEYLGATYHAMSRGNNGQDVFLGDDGCRLFLATLAEACAQTGWIIHAYALMGNHYHLLLETPEPNLVAGMKWFQGAYTQRFNAMFSRRGHLFQGRYKALPVETGAQDSYFREVGQYVHLNPFRAGLAGVGTARALEDYAWSSYPAYVGAAQPPPWLARTRLLKACGLPGRASGLAAKYRALVEARMRDPADLAADAVQTAVGMQIERGWYVGSDKFRNHLAGTIVGSSDNLRGPQRTAHGEAEAERLLGRALEGLKCTEEQMACFKCTRLEKQAVAWLLKSHTAVSVAWVAQRLDMGHRTNASRAISSFAKDLSLEANDLREKMLQFTG